MKINLKLGKSKVNDTFIQGHVYVHRDDYEENDPGLYICTRPSVQDRGPKNPLYSLKDGNIWSYEDDTDISQWVDVTNQIKVVKA